MILLLTAAALAQSPAHYSPDTIAQNSSIFRSYAERLSPQFDRLQNNLGRAGGGLSALEQGVLLLGERAPDGLATHLEASRRAANHSFLVAQEHVNLLENDSQAVFEAAMSRAIAQHAQGRTLVECSNPRGMMSFGPSRGQRNCEGDDLNAAIAASMDKDEQLRTSVESILSVEWPVVDFEAKPLEAVVVTGNNGHVSVELMAQRFLAQEIIDLYAALERDLAPIQAALDSGDETERETTLQQAWTVRQGFEQALGAEGERLWAAMEQPLAKKKMAIALCPNPVAFGGCPGEDRTDEVIAMLESSRKFKKAFR